jgi:uncharacterized protein YaiI (UPF0178 family)
MQIWVDADACPVVVKEILYRAAERTQISTTLVANQFLRTPPSAYINTMQVASGFDAADNRIVLELAAGDLVITADVPLAAQVIAKGAHALNPRGEMYTRENMQQHLAMRNLMEELRATGVEVNGPAAFNQSDRQAFAAALDRFLAKNPKI